MFKGISRPGLLDAVADTSTQSNICGAYFIAKPIPYQAWWMIFERVWHAWLVFKGKATAVHYAEDVKDTMQSIVDAGERAIRIREKEETDVEKS